MARTASWPGPGSVSSGADQPSGVRAHFERLRGLLGEEHAALHAVLECLGETLWQAQRLKAAPDERVYLDCLERRRRG